MNRKHTAQSALFNLRASIALLLCAAAACLLVRGTLLGFIRSEAPSKVAKSTLTFTERVAYERAIEEVYWRHRIWPKDNPQPKPPLDSVMSREQIEKKVTDYMRKAQLVADRRARPITGSDLQAEMDRMASHTLHPRVLLELFQALDNNPFVIAECLARPLVAERLNAELSGEDRVEAFAPANVKTVTATAPLTSQSYKLPHISVPLDCTNDSWTATATANAPDARRYHTAVWTGSEMIIWGGFNSKPPYVLNTGSRYTPSTDSWTATNMTNAPSARDFHAAVWTGTEMIVWAGYNGNDLNDGGRYNPATDTWASMSVANAPVPREQHSEVWSGREMIVWGGRDNATWFNSGGRYNPDTDGWTATTTLNAPERRWYHTAEWTGNQMVVWGGTNQTIGLNTGGKYNPVMDSWTATSTANAPLGRAVHTSIWSGSEMIVWGGIDATPTDLNTGGRYNPLADAWAATSLNNAPSPRDSHTAVWIGTEMIIWGGVCCSSPIDFNDGGRYNPGTDSWMATSIADAPHARDSHTAVWTGDKMIVWGGGYFVGSNYIYLNTGGTYCAQSGPTPTPTATSTSTPTPTATATATSTPNATPTATPTATVRPTPTPRPNVTPRTRPTPPPRP